MDPILLLEINEVPDRVLDFYLARPEYPELRRFFADARRFVTVAEDEGELSPWITWPTFHRGTLAHKIRYLGQDPKSFQGTTIWEEFRKRGANIGVFGSMQSWPPSDPGENGFYVPDTFAADERCIPAALEPLQKFNLDQVRANGRVIRNNPLADALRPEFLQALAGSGLRPKTALRLAGQLLREKFRPEVRSHRAIYQTVLFWDVFRKLYETNTPDFATFFTNHVASAQHRFWDKLFPEDFGGGERDCRIFDFAFLVLEEILADVRRWQEKNPALTVVFATSMGQEAKHRHAHPGMELSITDSPALFRALGAAGAEPLLAMVPQVAARLPRKELVRAQETLLSLRTRSGRQVFFTEEKGDTLSVTLVTPNKEDCLTGNLFADGKTYSFAELGISCFTVDAGTGYHIREGILALKGKNAARFEAEAGKKIPSHQVKERLLRL